METGRIPAGPGTAATGWQPGEGPRLVFLHGLGCAGSLHWPPLARSAALQGCSWRWVDLLGFGDSDRPAAFSYRLEDQAAWLGEALLAEGQPLTLVGHSLGGTLAVLVAERLLAAGRPPRALVLLEPNLRAEDATGSARTAATALGAFIEAWPAWVEGVRSPSYRASLRRADPVAFHRSAVSLVEHGRGALARLAALPVRSGYVLGGQSDGATRETARLAAAAGVRVETVAAAGHNFWEDDAEGTARAIRALG